MGLDVREEEEGVSYAEMRRLVLPPCGGCRPLNAQEGFEDEANSGGAHWAEGQAVEPTVWPTDLGPPLPRPSVEQFKSACRTFAEGTGLGWDALHPRALLRLLDEALAALMDILIKAENDGVWPRGLGVVIVVLLPKGDGGFGPIGLFPSAVRIWMRLRRSHAREWEVEHDRSFLYAGAAKGAQVAAWRQSAHAEAAVGVGATYGQLLLDLVKAFDDIPRHLLVTEAVAVGFPLRLLRLSLAAYA